MGGEFESSLSGLLELGTERRLESGSVLFRENDPIRGFYWVEEGAVRVFQLSFAGREVEVGRFGPGEMVATALCLARERFPLFAQAAPRARVVFLPKEPALRRIASDPVLARHFLGVLAERCQGLQEKVQLQAFHDVRERLLRYLVQECPHDGRCRFRLTRSKREIAQILWTTPETLSRTLRALSEEGLVEVAGREIRVVSSCARDCPGA